MPIRRLCLGQMGVAIENQMPNARSRDVSENSLHISSLRVSLHLAKPSVWKNSRGQGNIRSKLGYALSYSASGTWSVRGRECLFTIIQPRNPQWIKSRRLSMAHTPCLGWLLPVLPPSLPRTAPLCPGNPGHTSGFQYLVGHRFVSSSFCPLPPLSVFICLQNHFLSEGSRRESVPRPLLCFWSGPWSLTCLSLYVSASVSTRPSPVDASASQFSLPVRMLSMSDGPPPHRQIEYDLILIWSQLQRFFPNKVTFPGPGDWDLDTSFWGNTIHSVFPHLSPQ